MTVLLVLCAASAAAAQRQGLPVVGEVVSSKGDEQIQFQGDAAWQGLGVGQELVNGDQVRTGAYGALALVFRDGTQLRLQQNSQLRIEYLRKGPDGDEGVLSLLKGSVWSRVAREFLPKLGRAKTPPRVQLQTPVATIGIRGTDWHVLAEPQATTLTVLSGEAELSNAHGMVAVRGGESGSARPGQAPGKRVLVDLRDRPLISMDIEADWLDLLPADATDDAIPGLALLRERRYAEADRELQRQIEREPGFAEPRLLHIWLTSFKGEQRRAIEMAQSGAGRFPKDSRFPALLAHLYFVTDEREDMLRAASAATALAPAEPFGWHVAGLYHHYAEPNAPAAKQAYLRAVRARHSYSPSWNNLALVHVELAEYADAELAFREAIAAEPNNARIRANYGFLLALVHRLDEADQVFQSALKQEPDAPYGLLGLGYLDLYQGRPDAGVEDIIRATTVYPELPGGSSSLAAAYYQAGQHARARQELDNARRFDPNDPVPDVIGSIMAVDHYQAGEAIELARQGFAKTLRAESFAVDSLANAKSGSATLGNAFSNLGLHEWGGYYTELVFDPYLASGYFYLAQRDQFESERARLGANRQGLLLDPLAASSPNRYYEPFRSVRHDLSLFGQIGREDGANTYSIKPISQGLLRVPQPVAYFAQFAGDRAQGIRENSRAEANVLFGQLGTSWDSRRHNLFVELDVERFEDEQPGSVFDPDFNDRDRDEFAFVSVGYQYRIDFDNRVLARVVGGTERREFRENDAQLAGLSARDFSLLNAFGFDLPFVRDLYAQGLYEVTPNYGGAAPNDPDFAVGAVGAGFGGPALADPIPAGTDTDPIVDDTFRSRNYALQLRHMLTLAEIEFSYGAELYPIREKETFRFAELQPLGSACLAFDPPDPGPACPAATPRFDFGPGAITTSKFDNRTDAWLAYVQARHKFTPAFWAEGGLFYRKLEVEFGDPFFTDIDESQADPRLGLGWRVNDRHWLRAAWQRELFFPQRASDSLAPVAAMGLVVPQTVFTLFEGGTKVEDLQLRWDAEWRDWLFTFVNLETEQLEEFGVGDAFYAEGQVDTATLGANFWLRRNWGLTLAHSWRATEDQSGAGFNGNEIVLLPERFFDLGLTWVHPRQVRTVLNLQHQGERFDDQANTTALDGYWIANAAVHWEPGRKHWLLGAGINNLSDEEFELAAGFPGAGRLIYLLAEYRR